VPQAARVSAGARQQRVTAQLTASVDVLDALTVALCADSGTAHHAAATIHSLLYVEADRVPSARGGCS
jgi:hypothetical protein